MEDRGGIKADTRKIEQIMEAMENSETSKEV